MAALSLPGDKSGWVRDDLVAVQGDGSRFGYPNEAIVFT